IALTQCLGSDAVGSLFETKTAAGFLQVDTVTGLLMPQFSPFQFATVGAALGAVLYALGWLSAGLRAGPYSDLALWSASGLVYGAIVGLGYYFYLLVPADMPNKSNVLVAIVTTPSMYVTIGVPWILAAQW